MGLLRLKLRPFLTFFLIALANFAGAQSIEVGPKDALVIGVAMVRDGNVQGAIAIADALIERDSGDFSALLLRTDAALVAQQNGDAIAFGARAFAAARTDGQRTQSACLVAFAHTRLENFTRAQLWLRRAAQYAPDDAAKAVVAKDFRTVRERNPWSSSLRFGIFPRSNINNGSTAEIYYLPGLDFPLTLQPSSRALSRFEISGGFSSQYRLHLDDVSATFLTATGSFIDYRLSNTSAALVPDIDGSDYATSALDFGITHRRILADGFGPTTFTLKFGRNWSGKALALSDTYLTTQYIDARIAQSVPLGDRDTLSFSAARQRAEEFDDDSSRFDFKTTLGASWVHVRDNQDRFTFGVTGTRKTSAAADSDYTSLKYRIGYDFAEPILNTRFGISADYEERSFDESIYVAGPRNDTNVGVTLSMQFPELAFYWFEPVVNLEARRNRSNPDLFDRDYQSIGFDLRSSF